MVKLRTCIIALAAMLTAFTVGARRVAAPDFAFPKKVIESSEKELKEAIASDDGPATVRALMDISLARSAVSNENLPASLRQIELVSSKVADPVVHAMLDMLRATIYTQIFNDNAMVYTRRLPLSSSDNASDFNLWSGARFKSVVDSLTQAAMTERSALLAEPIGRWDNVVTNADNRITSIYFPTLFDFVTVKSAELLGEVFRPGNVIGARYMTATPGGNLPMIADRGAAAVLAALDSRVEAHDVGSAPMVSAAIARIKFISDHLFDMSGFSSSGVRACLYELYGKVADSEFSGDVLCSIDPYCNDFASQRLLWEKATANIAKYPGFVRVGNLKQIVADIERPRIGLDYPSCAAPSVPARIRVKAMNITDGHIDIYRVNSEGRIRFNRAAPGDKTGTLTVTSGFEIPSEGQLELSFVFPEPGRYIFVSDIESEMDTYPSIVITNLAVATQSFDKSTVWVVDPADGSPQADVTVMSSDGYDLSGSSPLGKTGPNGSMTVASDKRGRFIFAQNGKDRSRSVHLWFGGFRNLPDSVTAINGYTSLPIYRPGDVIDWSAFCYIACRDSRHTSEGIEIEVEMLDANSSSVDTALVVTDTFGRVAGSFTAPRGALSGTYTLLFKTGSRVVGRASFEVTDYKLPTFSIDLKDALADAAGNYRIEGRALTYAGFPVADADVSLTLSVGPRFRWWSRGGNQQFYTSSTVTDNEGNFTLIIDRATIDGSPAPDGFFTASVAVTSTAAETVAGSTSFMVGKANRIRMTTTAEAVDVSKPIEIMAEVVDVQGNRVDTPVAFTISVADSVVASGVIPVNGLTLRRHDLPQGRATMVFKAADADSLSVATVFYRPDADNSPVDETLWTPVSSLAADNAGGIATLSVAAAHPLSMLYTLVADDKIVTRKWIKLHEGFNNIDVRLPSGCVRAMVYLNAMAGYQASDITLPVTVANPSDDIKIAVSSFRDKVCPGDVETWCLTVTDADGKGVRSAILADMYNDAVTALASPSFNFARQSLPNHYLNWNWSQWGNERVWFSAPVSLFRCVVLDDPDLQTYGRGWVNSRYMTMYKMTSRNSLADSSSPMLAGAVAGAVLRDVEEHSEEIVAEEAKHESYDEDGGSGAIETDGSVTAPGALGYRDSEVALAFFRPMLTTDDSGSLNLSFTVPNANTRWIAELLAVTSNVATASSRLVMTASKPLMVQPNLPRFMRAGDRAEIISAVMNNSDKAVTAATVVELFDPTDGRVLETFNRDTAVGAGLSATVTVRIKAPFDKPFIGFRIRSSADGFTDGEQALIAILPATTAVIETIPFYIVPDSMEHNVAVPATPAGGRVTLEFCENPVWSVVTALPGLIQTNTTTTIEAARSIYSAAIASGILRSNPAIARGLEVWTRSDRSDSTLVSMLERNSDLKIALLKATPWMVDAMSDTERMTRLSLLFDKSSIRSVINSAVATLARNTTGDGWGWIAGDSEPSRWATSYALSLLGHLNQLGFSPRNADLQRMINKAVTYIDREVADDFRRNPSGNYVDYVAMRDMFPDVRQSSAAASVTSATIQQLLGRWRDLGVEAKATAAIILENHNYHASAVQIIESLREYSNRSAVKGMWWPSVNQTNSPLGANGVTARVLDAFVAVTPSSRDEIDAIRQWLILQKQAQNWGTSDATTAVIASVLTSSKRWVAPAQGVTITFDGEKVIPGNIEKTMGYLRAALPSRPDESLLTIVKPGDAPSWGAVYRQFTDTITNVRPSSCDALSISKRLLLVEDTTAGQRLKEVKGALETGSKVRVELYVEVTRALQYVVISDQRAACFEPVDQMPGYVWSEGLGFYRENTDSETRLFIGSLPEGKYLLTYDVWVNNAGEFISGVATAQSQYVPAISAHSSGFTVKAVNDQ